MKLLSLSLLLSMLLIACGGNVNYNEKVVDLYKNYTDRLASDLNRIVEPNKTSATSAVDRISTLTDSCMQATKELEVPKGAEDFQQKMLAVYSHVNGSMVPAAKSLLTTDSTADVDNYNVAVDAYNASQDKLGKLEDAAIDAQAAWARKINMKIEN